MGDIIIRKMEQKDIPYAVEIENECFSLPWSKKSFEDSLALKYGYFLVAEAEGKVAGYVGMYKVANEGDITNIAVASNCRRRGMAAKLLETLINDAKEQELYDINLEVRESNRAAIALYEKFGFENLGIRKSFYEKPVENAIIMRKSL